MPVTQKLFTELFRAKNFDSMVLPPRVRNVVSKGLTQNIFLYGPQGTGKSTIARILIEGYDVLKLNGSSDNGIDVIRNQVVSFATAISLEHGSEKLKVIFIDEADGLTDNAWDALRETIEHYASSVRFICTCNRIDKIPAPIKSRFECIPMFPINKEEESQVIAGYCEFVSQILTGIKVSFDQDTLYMFVRNSFPDMRTILNNIQSIYTQGLTELNKDALIKSFDCSDLLNIIVTGNDPIENYKFIATNYASNPDDAMMAISKSIIDFIKTNYPQFAPKVPYIITTVAEYMYQLTTAPDKMLVLLACVYKLQMIIKS
jgi:DNA polymerase III delta prime subunit